jgi:hypothetical protein
MAAVLTSVPGGVEVTDSSLGNFQFIPSQSVVYVNASASGIVVVSPSQDRFEYTNADMDAEDADEAALTFSTALSAGSGAAYTEISFTWYQVGTAAPVIASKNSSSAITVTPGYEEEGLVNFTFPTGTFTDTAVAKVEVIPAGFVNAPSLRSFAYVIGGDQLSCYIYDPASSYAAVDGIGDLASEKYVTTVIRIFPA